VVLLSFWMILPPANSVISEPEISGLWMEMLLASPADRIVVPVTLTAPPAGS
jgi:hypothetical protein